MGTGHQKDQAMIRSVGFSAPPPSTERGEGLKTELTTDDAYRLKPP